MKGNRRELGQSRRWVIKIGSALLTNDGKGLATDRITGWVEQMAGLREAGVELVLVSSGSVAEGMARLDWTERPDSLHNLQAAAAVGQMGLIQAYESHFQRYDTHTAQVLLTHDDLSDRSRYLNARSTLQTLLSLCVVPVVNENDTVVTEEIQFGDNDTLAGLVANLVQADVLVILTDQQGLFEKDPRQHADSALVTEGRAGDRELEACAGGGGTFGRGGMRTKLKAAALAARSGTATIICSGQEPDILRRIAAGEPVGTVLWPEQAPMAARKQWLAGHLQVRGTLSIDAGAAKVIRHSGSSLLAVGVTAVTGNFVRGEVVACLDPDGHRVAVGLINYAADEVRRIMGLPSDRIAETIGYIDEPDLIGRENLVLVPG